MRRSLIAILLLIPLLGCANGGWTREDSYRQAAFITVTGIDWMQTRKIAQNPNDYHEHNPVLGSHPSTQAVDTYFLAAMAAHTAVALALPPDYRTYWQYVFIASESAVVGYNLSIGLGVGF